MKQSLLSWLSCLLLVTGCADVPENEDLEASGQEQALAGAVALGVVPAGLPGRIRSGSAPTFAAYVDSVSW